jgi:hypothetical protein
LPGGRTVLPCGTTVTKSEFAPQTGCYFCHAARGKLVVPQPAGVPGHFFIRCTACHALWKFDVNSAGVIVGAPDPPWFPSFDSLQALPTRHANELRTILRDAAEGWYTEHYRNAAAALRRAAEMFLFGEALRINLHNSAPPNWNTGIDRLERQLRDSHEGRELFREIRPHLDEVYDVGLNGAHIRPRHGGPVVPPSRIGSAFGRFDELLRAWEATHAGAT